MKLQDLKEKLIKEDKLFRDEYFKENLAFGISRMISNLRAYEGIDQTKLAKSIKTKQSGISRLERGNSLPSITLIDKIAKSLDYKIKIKLISNKTGRVFDSDGNIYINYRKACFNTANDSNNLTSDSPVVEKEIKSPFFHYVDNGNDSLKLSF